MKKKKKKLILFFLCMIALSGTGKEATAAGVRLDGYFDRSPGVVDLINYQNTDLLACL